MIPHCPDDWPYHPWHRLVRRSLPLAAEVEASRAGRRAWVHVRPLLDASYSVYYFEIESDRYDEVLETMDYDEPGMLLEEERLVVTGEAELRVVLGRWLDDLTLLVDPGVSTRPI